jgi:hypothetical protein
LTLQTQFKPYNIYRRYACNYYLIIVNKYELLQLVKIIIKNIIGYLHMLSNMENKKNKKISTLLTFLDPLGPPIKLSL